LRTRNQHFAFAKGEKNMNTNRPLTATIAIVLLTLMSVVGLILPLLSLLFSLTNPPPLIVRVDEILVMGVGGLIAVFGLWKLKRWGLVLTGIIATPTLLLGVYGLLGPVPIEGKVASVVLGVLNAVVLVLVALPATRRAYAAVRGPVVQA
jgi:hypothetical protein